MCPARAEGIPNKTAQKGWRYWPIIMFSCFNYRGYSVSIYRIFYDIVLGLPVGSNGLHQLKVPYRPISLQGQINKSLMWNRFFMKTTYYYFMLSFGFSKAVGLFLVKYGRFNALFI